jgi:hypothetical protein
MVRRRLLLLPLLSLLTLVIACGSSSPSTTAATQPTARPATGASASGPNAHLDPASGPPGTEITVSGSGWTANAEVIVIGPARGDPYVTTRATADGSFNAKFRLEKQPDGSELHTGSYRLIARSGATEVQLPFLVETSRPVRRPGDGG